MTAVTSSPRTTPPDAGTATRVSLVAVLTVVTLELARASGPFLDRASAGGVALSDGTALVTYAVGGVAAAVLLLATGRRATGSPNGRTLLAGTAVLAVARLLVQGLDGRARDVGGLVAVAVTVAVLSLAVSFVAGRVTGGRQAALGLVLGSGLSTGLGLTLGTWDAVWRHDITGWIVAVVLAVGIVLLALAASTHDSTGRPRRLWALGPFVALAAMIIANPAFVAAQTGDPLREVGLVLVVGHLVAVWLLLSPHLLTGTVRVAAAVVVPAATAAAFLLTGAEALVAIVVLQIAMAVMLVAAMSAHRIARLGVPATAVAVGLVGLGLIVPVLAFALDTDLRPGIEGVAIPIAAGVALAIGGLRRRTPTAPAAATPAMPSEHNHDAQPFRSNAVRMLAIPAVTLAVVGWWPSAGAGPVNARARTSSLVVVDWNLNGGVAPATDVDPEGIARTIEAQDPDVVTLQEVSRGWVLDGGVDLATWLSHRLGMRLVFAPAADRQSGNAILARSALTDPVVTSLPADSGRPHRTAVSATVTLADGSGVRFTSVRLQDGDASTPTRLVELQALLAVLPAAGPAVIAADIDAGAGRPGTSLLEAGGWVDALDLAARPDALTFPSDDPTTRTDWVLGRGVDVTHAEVLTGPRSSDHLPVVATLSPAR